LCPSANAQTITDYRHLVLDGHTLKWGSPVLGTGARVTYALLDRDIRFADARNCRAMSPIETALRPSGIATRDFVRELHAALELWTEAADISFAPSDPAHADILIGAQSEPFGYAFTNVFYDKAVAGPGPRSLTRSTICLNPQRAWKIGFDGDLDVYDLRYTLAHELGHAIGLDHPAMAGELMAFKYGERFRALQGGDIHGIETLYGPHKAAAPVQIGAISAKGGPIAR
jgi:hypothetical protein